MKTLLLAAVAVLTTASATAKTPVTIDAKTLHAADIVAHVVVAGEPTRDVLEIFPEVYVYHFSVLVKRSLKGTLQNGHVMHYSTGDKDDVIRSGDSLLLALRKLDQNLDGAQTNIQVLKLARASSRGVASAMTTLRRRPSAGKDVSMSITQVPPARAIKWRNPYGDGKFRVTLTNFGRRAAAIPPVEVTNNAGTTQLSPGFTLAAGATRVVEVDTLELDWKGLPGGARLEITVQAGDKSVSSFFYYSEDVHGPMLRGRRIPLQ